VYSHPHSCPHLLRHARLARQTPLPGLAWTRIINVARNDIDPILDLLDARREQLDLLPRLGELELALGKLLLERLAFHTAAREVSIKVAADRLQVVGERTCGCGDLLVDNAHHLAAHALKLGLEVAG
jgi:hypothetical protein